MRRRKSNKTFVPNEIYLKNVLIIQIKYFSRISLELDGTNFAANELINKIGIDLICSLQF